VALATLGVASKRKCLEKKVTIKKLQPQYVGEKNLQHMWYGMPKKIKIFTNPQTQFLARNYNIDSVHVVWLDFKLHHFLCP
jgi:hypothetical protein